MESSNDGMLRLEKTGEVVVKDTGRGGLGWEKMGWVWMGTGLRREVGRREGLESSWKHAPPSEES